MNKRFNISLIVATVACFISCQKVKYQKDVHDYYPKVATSNVSILADGSAQVSARLLSSGSGDLYFIGFCMDTVPNPEMHINQQLAQELWNDSFATVYKGLDGLKRYHVRSFAANEFGYSYGNDMVIEHSAPDTASIPCHPGTNTIIVEDSFASKSDRLSNIGQLDPSTHEVSVSSLNNSFQLSLAFGKTPVSGKYTIWHNPTMGSNEVSVLFGDPNQGSYEMSNGGELYVEQIDATRIKVWICHQASGSGYFITSSFITK